MTRSPLDSSLPSPFEAGTAARHCWLTEFQHVQTQSYIRKPTYAFLSSKSTKVCINDTLNLEICKIQINIITLHFSLFPLCFLSTFLFLTQGNFLRLKVLYILCFFHMSTRTFASIININGIEKVTCQQIGQSVTLALNTTKVIIFFKM